MPPPVVALVLPGAQTPFARAAEAVREGFVAARGAIPDAVSIEVVETEPTAAATLRALQTARERGTRIAVGPLTRDAVTGVIERGDAGLPVLLLAMPDKSAAIPRGQLAFGLSVEDEAAFLVREVLREPAPAVTAAALPAATVATPVVVPVATPARRHVVVVGPGPFMRRIGAAFVATLREAGLTPLVLDYPALDAEAISAEIAKAPVASVLFALEPADAAQVRTRLPVDAPLFATSQISAGAGSGSLAAIDLEGIRFVDLPWMIDARAGSLAAIPRAPANYGADLQRLYALGIDAMRVVAEWLRGNRRIALDGATGRLWIDPERSGRVERKLASAVFHDGRIVGIDSLRAAIPDNEAACGEEPCPDDVSAKKPGDPDPAPAGR